MLFRLFYTSSHWLFFHLQPKPEKPTIALEKPYIILCGIEPVNAYSIEKIQLFIQLCEKLDNRKKVVLFSKISAPATIRNLETVHWEFHERARSLGPLARCLYPKGLFDEQTVRSTAEQACAMVDLGDYQATSTKASGFTANMMANIVFAKRFGLPFYVMSQSFGPFNYPKPLRYTLLPMLKNILPYCTSISAREDWGVHALNKLSEGIEVQKEAEFLLLSPSDLQASSTWDRKTSVMVTPSESLSSSPRMLDGLLSVIDHAVENVSLKSKYLYLYDHADISSPQYSPPHDWIIQFAADTEDLYQGSCNDRIKITDKYHAALRGLLSAEPAIYWQANPMGVSLYRELGLELFLVNDAKSMEKALTILADQTQATEVATHIRKNIDVIRQSLPRFFKDLQETLA